MPPPNTTPTGIFNPWQDEAQPTETAPAARQDAGPPPPPVKVNMQGKRYGFFVALSAKDADDVGAAVDCIARAVHDLPPDADVELKACGVDRANAGKIAIHPGHGYDSAVDALAAVFLMRPAYRQVALRHGLKPYCK